MTDRCWKEVRKVWRMPAPIRVNDTLNNGAGESETYSGYAKGIPIEQNPSSRRNKQANHLFKGKG
ncbi:MAG: hypothetical protein JW947_08895 [Sedimentisphaerales bacterium]|nr:hypothetical protein [Sedimentisphaerales bacterium]